MSRAVTIARLGAWCALMGSALALVAFFLPAYGPPPGSLWDFLVRLVLNLDQGSGVLVVLVGALLLVLLSIAVLAALAACLRPPPRALIHWYWGLTLLTLSVYPTATLGILFFIAVDAAIGESYIGDYVGPVNIGTWLLPLGLGLVLLGSILLEKRLLLGPASVPGQDEDVRRIGFWGGTMLSLLLIPLNVVVVVVVVLWLRR